ncbi:MAG TPA: FMN-binding negative transcriptional regulator [Candidatus Binataceae bacterium]|nr:FMN-binding negative transcriptional regulator [Candidatus Binataceae bacterium]
MYIPDAFRESDPARLHQVIRDYSFATLITHSESLVASHVPILLDPARGEHGTLRGHMARANPQWRDFKDDAEVMAIFHGPHTYISPSWYPTHPAVPTWNYVAVHAYGVPRLIEERAALRRLLDDLVRMYESGFEHPWQFDLPQRFTETMIDMIVGFEIPITRLEGKFKLNQNRSAADRRGVIEVLQQSSDPVAREISALMAARTPVAGE